MGLRVRSAQEEDVALLFEWANDPLVRKMSFNQHPISHEVHAAWFEKVLESKTIHLLVVESYENSTWIPAGAFRFDESDGEVSISLGSKFRGKSLASPLIRAGMEHIGQIWSGERFIARIKPENWPSIRAFERAGFSFSRETVNKGHVCLEFVYPVRPQGRVAEGGNK